MIFYLIFRASGLLSHKKQSSNSTQNLSDMTKEAIQECVKVWEHLGHSKMKSKRCNDVLMKEQGNNCITERSERWTPQRLSYGTIPKYSTQNRILTYRKAKKRLILGDTIHTWNEL